MTLASTPSPPYVAVIFTSARTDDDDGFDETDAALNAMVREQPGFLGLETATDGRTSITVSYWSTAADAASWKNVAEHRVAQELGRTRWFDGYRVRVATVDRQYGFDGDRSPSETP